MTKTMRIVRFMEDARCNNSGFDDWWKNQTEYKQRQFIEALEGILADELSDFVERYEVALQKALLEARAN